MANITYCAARNCYRPFSLSFVTLEQVKRGYSQGYASTLGEEFHSRTGIIVKIKGIQRLAVILYIVALERYLATSIKMQQYASLFIEVESDSLRLIRDAEETGLTTFGHEFVIERAILSDVDGIPISYISINGCEFLISQGSLVFLQKDLSYISTLLRVGFQFLAYN